jgi:hypothetical protein
VGLCCCIILFCKKSLGTDSYVVYMLIFFIFAVLTY